MRLGYIYIRSNKYWDIDNVYKLGQTVNIHNIEQIYRTNELVRGHYKIVIEIPFDIQIDNKEKSKEKLKEELEKLEKALQTYFKKFNIQNDGGTGFYNKSILSEIENYFIENKIECKFLTEIEIEELIKKDNTKCEDSTLNKILTRLMYISMNKKNTDIALYIYEKFKNEIKCSSIINSSWYYLNDDKWLNKLENDIKKKILDEVSKDYIKYAILCNKKKDENIDEIDKETWLHRASTSTFISLKLKEKKFSNLIFIECKKLFFDENFEDILNKIKEEPKLKQNEIINKAKKEDDENQKKISKKKEKIPVAVRKIVWNTYIGKDNKSGKCLCCDSEDISNTNFECGHIKSEKNGGEVNIENLRPICGNCNKSIGSNNMDEFMIKYKIKTPKNWNGFVLS